MCLFLLCALFLGSLVYGRTLNDLLVNGRCGSHSCTNRQTTKALCRPGPLPESAVPKTRCTVRCLCIGLIIFQTFWPLTSDPTALYYRACGLSSVLLFCLAMVATLRLNVVASCFSVEQPQIRWLYRTFDISIMLQSLILWTVALIVHLSQVEHAASTSGQAPAEILARETIVSGSGLPKWPELS